MPSTIIDGKQSDVLESEGASRTKSSNYEGRGHDRTLNFGRLAETLPRKEASSTSSWQRRRELVIDALGF